MNEAHFSRRIGRSIGAVLAGMFAGIILTLGTDAVLHAIHVFPPWGLSCSQRSIALSTVFWAATFIARLAPDRPMQHALVGGFVGLVVSILGAAVTWNKGPAFGPHWYPVALGGARDAAGLGRRQTPRYAVARPRRQLREARIAQNEHRKDH